MQTELIRELNEIFKEFPRFWDGEKLCHSRIIEAISQKSPELIKSLVNNEKIKSVYGTNIDGILIFDFDKLCSLLKYKEYWANSFTKYRNKVGLTSEGKYLDYSSDVVLDFPFKDCVLEGGMTKEEQGKNEVYYNEVIARDEIDRLFSAKALTKVKRFTAKGVEKNITEFDINENLIIKGNNLIALHSLKERYIGKIKLIYIDPPYNTGSDSFKYNDKFKRSTWLTFMKNRLEIAKELLSDDGLIFIHISDRELHYLKVMIDGIFTEDNFVATIPRKTRNGKSDVSYKLSQDYDWILVYTQSRNKDNSLFKRTIDRKYYESADYPSDKWRLSDLTNQKTIKENPNANFTLVNPKDKKEYPVNPNRSWSVSINTVAEHIEKGKIVFPGDYDFLNIKKPAMRIFMSEEIKYKGHDFDKAYVSTDFINKTMDSFLNDLTNRKGNDELVGIFHEKGFSYPKPELMIKQIVQYCSNPGDLILDFHLGSGTTAAVAHKMGRRYIGIEQMDYINDITIPRLQKVIDGEKGGISKDVNWQGGGSFVYAELKELNYQLIHKIQKAQSYTDLENLFKEMKTESHLNYQVALENVLSTEYEVDGVFRMVTFGELELCEQKRLLIEILDKNQLYVNESEMSDRNLDITQSDKMFTNSFYNKD
ncbi:adenine-specific DNA-methyltransferase [Candidatus Liberibacter solanacearum]|uniref:DNA methyltransferase n=1 Tax=Candidatus Liberibacter solanacearum TaxID=556287 RepID=UPI00387191C2